MVMSQAQNSVQNHNIKICNKAYERVEQLKHLGTALASQVSIH